MNHRISEIADSVGLGIKHNGIVLTKDVDAAAAFEKFAQLIVQECVDKIAGVPNAYDDYRDHIENAMREYCIYSIKQHFGVEE